MGKTGGHKKRTIQTGSQKKITKQYEKEFRAAKGTRKAGEKELARLNSPEGQAFLDKFISGEGQLQSIQNAQQLLNPILQNQHQEALKNFDRSTLPKLQAQHGGNRGSSAFNQALSASRIDLDKHLADRISELSLNYGSQLSQQQQQSAQQQYLNRFGGAQQASQAGLFQGNTAIQTDRFALAPRSTPLVAQLVGGAAQGGAQGFAQSAGSTAPAATSTAGAGTAGAAGASSSAPPIAAAAAAL